MYCSSCGSQNLHTDLRCLRCGTSLIGDTVGGSAKFRKASSEWDSRMYGGVGGVMGFFLIAVLCKTVLNELHLSDAQVYGSAVFGALVFGALGQYIAKRKF